VNRNVNAQPTSGQANSYTRYTYDSNGRPTQRDRRYDGGVLEVFAFGWDGDGRLRSLTQGGVTQFTARYDGSGLRRSKRDSATGQHDCTWGPRGVLRDSHGGGTTCTPGLAERKGAATGWEAGG
jgi:YD repeat-containing protein